MSQPDNIVILPPPEQQPEQSATPSFLVRLTEFTALIDSNPQYAWELAEGLMMFISACKQSRNRPEGGHSHE